MVFTIVIYKCSHPSPGPLMENTRTDTIRQMVHIARLYYEEGRTQEDIARECGISRPIISRLLKQARDEGIVQITIVDPFQYNLQLAERLRAATGLSDIIVCPGPDSGASSLLRHLGLATAHYLNDVVEPETVLGVGWGRTLYAAAQALEPKSLPNMTVVPLVGGLGQVSASFQVHEITRLIASNYGCRQETFYVPALSPDAAVKHSLLASNDVQFIHKWWAQTSIALVGIGNVSFDSEMAMLFADYLDESVRSHLLANGAVGDICMRFFDRQGRYLPPPVDRVLGVELEQLKHVPRVIAVAGGPEKAPAIIGAVRGKYISSLITDESAARAVLTLLEQEKDAHDL